MAASAAGSFAGLFASNTARAAARAASAARPPADSFIRVAATGNNIHVTISDIEGRVVSRSSGGVVGYKHRSRASPEAALAASRDAAKKALGAGYAAGHLELRGPSSGRGQLLQGILEAGMRVVDIRDPTPVPTPGCRPKKARRR